MRKIKLHTLIVEDSANDAELIILELKYGGYDLEWEIVRRLDEMNRALEKKEWDVIISDYNLPGFSGLEALTISRAWDPDIPFILVSGKIGEETAVEVMKYRASDYINKDHLSRLVPAIKRELADARARRDHKNAQKALKVSEEQYRSFVENFQGVAFSGYGNYNFDFLHGNIDILTGYSEEDFISGRVHFDQLIHPEDSEWVQEDLNRFMSSPTSSLQRKYRIQDITGEVHWILEGISKFRTNNGVTGLYGTIQDITERENAIEMLKKSESRYKELFENMGNGVAVLDAVDDGEDMVFVDFNSSAEKIEGLKREDIIGRQVTDVFPGIEEFGLLNIIKRVWKTSLPEYHPVSLYTDDRIVGWRESYVYKLPSGEVVVVYDDVTESKLAEDALRKSEEKYRTILEGIEEAYYEIDLSGNFTFFNDSLCRIFGYLREELIVMNYADCMDDENAYKINRVLNDAYQSGEVIEVFDCDIVRMNGVRRVIEMSVSLVRDNSDELIGFRGIIRDITERKMAEVELQRAYEALKGVDKMKSEFAAIATHEIGTPLSVIKANTEMLEDGMFGDITKDQLERLEIIKKNVDHLVKLNREMMDISRIDAGRLKLRKEPALISDLIRDAAKDMETFAENKELEITVDLPKESLLLNCDSDRVRQVVSNLVNNAIKFTPKHGKIGVGVENLEEFVMVKVFDNGIGIPKEEHENIFKRFYEIGDYLSHESGGTGLGLSIVKGIVEAHGGRVWTESALGEGSTFYFTLPVQGAGDDKSLF